MPADRPMTICLSDLNYFESISARMPTESECAGPDFSAGVPVVVIRFTGGREAVYRADLTEFTLAPPVEPGELQAATAHVLSHVIEQIHNYTSDLSRLAESFADSHPARVVELANELHTAILGDGGSCTETDRSPSGVVKETGPLG